MVLCELPRTAMGIWKGRIQKEYDRLDDFVVKGNSPPPPPP
jgi:hypothetical protein